MTLALVTVEAPRFGATFHLLGPVYSLYNGLDQLPYKGSLSPTWTNTFDKNVLLSDSREEVGFQDSDLTASRSESHTV